MLLGSWGQRERHTEGEKEEGKKVVEGGGGKGGVPAYISREQNLGEWLEMIELETVRENVKKKEEKKHTVLPIQRGWFKSR